MIFLRPSWAICLVKKTLQLTSDCLYKQFRMPPRHTVNDKPTKSQGRNAQQQV